MRRLARLSPAQPDVTAQRQDQSAERLLDLRFLEVDVLASDRVVLLEAELIGGRSRVLLGDVEKSRACRAQELDFLRYRLCHDCPDLKRMLATFRGRTLLSGGA